MKKGSGDSSGKTDTWAIPPRVVIFTWLLAGFAGEQVEVRHAE